MNRRDFLKLLGAVGLGAAFPLEGWSADGVAAPVAAPFPAPAASALPIPPLAIPGEDGRLRLAIQKGSTLWRRRPTVTWGYNGANLGPALRLERGKKTAIEVHNALNEDTTIHWHGMEIPALMDGGPQMPIAPGATWTPVITPDQPAATCWYHPHPHRRTGRHVAMGLAGLLIVEDDDSQRLPLPKTWGVDDIPLIIQDKRLDADDQIDYAVDIVSAAVGWFGDMLLVNGAFPGRHSAPRGWVRLRLLNGCNGRSLRIAATDGRRLYVIAGDGGFLPEPVPVRELTLYTGERFEVMVDLADGKPCELMSLPVNQMGMTLPPFDAPAPLLRLQPSGEGGRGKLPDQLTAPASLPPLSGLTTRTLELTMDARLDHEGMMELVRRYGPKAMGNMGGHGMGMGKGMTGMGMMMGAADGAFDLWQANRINGQAFSMNNPMFAIERGRYERWIVSGRADMMLHPFHVHGTRFRILSENDKAPAAHRRGFKDTVHVEASRSEILVRFMHPATRERSYMAHCHLLEHEDTGMMMSFTVT